MKFAYDMRVLVYDPFISSEEISKNGYVRVEAIEEGLEAADYISLHLPHNKQTHHLINKSSIGHMKQGCKFINCARGPIADYDALCDALENGRIGMAGIDVYPEEPVSPSHRIFTLENVIATPHCAGDTQESRARIAESVAKDVLRVLRRERPCGFVNPSVANINPALFD
jgi:D-3-phosphoglycerate dehydrogenase